MIDIFDSLNTYVFGPIGFIISIVTLFISWNINKKVNQSLDKQKLKVDQPELSEKLDIFIKWVESSNFPRENIVQVRSLLSKISAEYPYFAEKRKIKKIIKGINTSINREELDSQVLLDNLIKLEANIRREIR
ncbi:MAG TPA: hypothetical protein H9948_11785 [Candidatus Jeotgalibaca merdavium]|uniref:Uncharacterized protein n=1 Tax=Candidatus Jeotgalibaca merdavium TaxID=2838627 RepID=A0A9D2KZR7_9LACT|nr:hypothetical protein [Candidatus Jeotgalibaca merdavium]